MSRDSFIQELAPYAIQIGKQYGIHPNLIIAQAAQETGWGRSVPGNNYFGVKSHGQDGGQNVATHEYVNGQRVNINDSFRQYDGVRQSMEDYAKFLHSNPRYSDVFKQTTFEGQAKAVADAGYATDPNYGNAITSIGNSLDLSAYQQPQMPPIPQPNTALQAVNQMAQGGNPTPPIPSATAILGYQPMPRPQQPIPEPPDFIAQGQLKPRRTMLPSKTDTPIKKVRVSPTISGLSALDRLG